MDGHRHGHDSETGAQPVASSDFERLTSTGRPARPAIIVSVEKRLRVFTSFEDADVADARDDVAMSPEERLSILIELRDRRHPDAAEQRLARVARVVELERS